MLSKWYKKTEIKEFIPSRNSESDWNEYYDYKKSFHEYYNSGDPITPKEQEISILQMVENHPEMEMKFWTVTKKDKIVGIINIGSFKPESASYETNKNSARIDVRILHEVINDKTIQEKTIEKIKQVAKSKNKTILISTLSNEDHKYLFTGWGFTIELEGRENRLQLSKVDWNMVDDWIQEGTKKNESELVLTEIISDEDIEAYCKTYTEVLNQQPFDNLDMSAMILTAQTYRQTEKDLKQVGQKRFIAYSREANGEVSGLTEIIYNPAKKTLANQGLTGVKQQFRGKKIGKWLKAELLKQIKTKNSDIKVIKSDNASSNDAMNAINKKLGFYMYKESSSAQLKLD